MNNKVFPKPAFLIPQILHLLRSQAAVLSAVTWALSALEADAQFAHSATSLVSAQVAEGQKRALLRLSISNPIPGGVPIAQWNGLGMRWESDAGVPLNATALAALIESFEIYRDANGSGVFELASDLLVSQSLYLPIAADGGLHLGLQDSDPATLQIPSGTVARFFLVATLQPGASTATPPTFRLTHLANGPLATTAHHAGTGAPLTAAPAPDLSTPVVTVTLDSAPVTSGLVPVVIQQPPHAALVPLPPAFQDAEGPIGNLSYAVLANTNPGLVGFIGIDPATGILTLDPQSGAQGQAQLTIQATDEGGNSVATGLNLTVGPLANYAAFATAYFGAGGPGVSGIGDDPARSGLSNLLKYAFFLHPLKNGDRAGLPTLTRTGQARVFTHLRPKFATDLLYAYEKSTDLTTWTPAIPGVDFFCATLDVGDGSQRVECLLLTSPSRTFMRAKVTLTSSPPAPPSAAPGTPLAGSPASPPPPPPPPPSDPPLPIESSAVFPGETQVLTGASLNYPSAAVTADLDNDGWADIVSISEGDDRVSWYRNQGGTFAPRQVFSGVTRSGSGVACADFTGDGLPDIASSSAADHKIAWYRSLGGGELASQQVISTTAIYATAVATADMDGDGLIDIVSGSGAGTDAKLAWYKNHGAPNYFIAGQENLIVSQGAGAAATSGNLPFSIAVANIDGDPNGFPDIAIAAYNESKVIFLRGNGTNTFTRQVLSSVEGGAIEVALGDIDGDGLKDIVSISAYGISALGQNGGRLVWYKNNGAAPFGPATPIAVDTAGLSGVTVADLNSDGKLDVLASTVRPLGVNTPAKLYWYRNLGVGAFGNPLTNAQLISTSGLEGNTVATADFDHNGLTDATVVWQGSHKHSVYLNFGGQASFTTTDTAPPAIYESGRDDMLCIALTNHGAPGQDHARLATVGLLFEKSAGIAMTAPEANQLIENLHFYADTDASGSFDIAIDQRLATVFHLPLSAGKATLSLHSAQPAAVHIPPGATRNFFAVPQIAPSGSSQDPNSFRIIHIVSGPGASTAKAAYTGASLVLAGSPANVASSPIAALFNSPPTTIGLPPLAVFDPTAASYILLPNFFADTEDGAAPLTYTIAANSNPALFRFAGIEPGTRRLSLKYRPGHPGTAALSIRATDSLGKFVTANLQVTVGYTFTDWSNLNPPPSSGSWPAGAAAIYAFGLNPLAPGDLTHAPHMWRQGSVKGLRHRRQRWSSDLSYGYLISPDMVTWIPAVAGTHFYEFRDHLPNGLDQSDVVLLVDWPRAFIRPQATLP